MLYLMENPVANLGYDLTFAAEVDEFGILTKRELKPDGDKIIVDETNKHEYVKLVANMKMTGMLLIDMIDQFNWIVQVRFANN